ncbi:hypothetical protein J6590_105034 [Homalodisca vitripennis]|nr:hypothetical protein J6590_105034 [Homalodisca vitripennis]
MESFGTNVGCEVLTCFVGRFLFYFPSQAILPSNDLLKDLMYLPPSSNVTAVSHWWTHHVVPICPSRIASLTPDPAVPSWNSPRYEVAEAVSFSLYQGEEGYRTPPCPRFIGCNPLAVSRLSRSEQEMVW